LEIKWDQKDQSINWFERGGEETCTLIAFTERNEDTLVNWLIENMSKSDQ